MAYRWELTNADGETKFPIVPKKKREKKKTTEKRKKEKKKRTDISIQIPFLRVKNFDRYHV